MAHAGGRPTKYKPEYCKKIIKFFDVEHATRHEKSVSSGKFDKTEYEWIGNPLPFLSGFARSIGVNQDTLHEWCKVYPEFSEAFTRAKELQKEMLASNGLRGFYDSRFAVFAMMNITDWRQKIEDDQANQSFKKIANALQAIRARREGKA